MKLASEESILSSVVRKEIIKQILDTENIKRKIAAFKAYEIFKDLTRKYVRQSFVKKYDESTVAEMEETLSNISICKKIISKKARVYKNGAIRTVEDGEKKDLKKEQKQVDDIYELINFDRSMKKANRFVELLKNSVVQILPIRVIEKGKERFDLKIRPIMSHLYDVVEDANDPEKALVYILSAQKSGTNFKTAPFSNRTDMRGARVDNTFRKGDGVDQTIADAQADEGSNKDEFIWWSEHFHFTTNEKGEIIQIKSPLDFANPIRMQTFHSLNKDQDGSYYAIGGEDLIDGSVLINMLITNLHFVAEVQGMGLFYLFGKNVPETFKVGTNKGIVVQVESSDDPTPQIGYATSNPPLQDHMGIVEQYIALLLSTNDLASSTVQGKLDGRNPGPGISQLIVGSEVTSSIEDEQQMFLDAEPELFNILRAWQNLFFQKNLLSEKYKAIGKIPESISINVKFLPFQEFLTEEQKLIIIEKRKALGIDTMVALLRRDNPDLSEEEAELKLLKITEEKLKKMGMFTNQKEPVEPTDPNDPDEPNRPDDE